MYPPADDSAEFVSTVPDYLIKSYQNDKPSKDSTWHRLMCDPRMEEVWRTLRSHAPSDAMLGPFVRSIILAYEDYEHWGNRRPQTRKELKKEQEAIARKAVALLDAISKTHWRENKLVCAVKEIQRRAETHALAFSQKPLSPDTRIAGANRDFLSLACEATASDWTPREAEWQKAEALRLRENDPAFAAPLVQRSRTRRSGPVKRNSQPYGLLLFLRTVSDRAERDLNLKSDATLATLATVVLNRGTGQEIAAQAVKDARPKSRDRQVKI